MFFVIYVASFTDAWIETVGKILQKEDRVSHLLQMRGLKHRAMNPQSMSKASHLLQMRGLKLFAHPLSGMSKKSHLLQMRGLKPKWQYFGCIFFVASFTDAWIETIYALNDYLEYNVASFTDAWIETGYRTLLSLKFGSRIFYRCVD